LEVPDSPYAWYRWTTDGSIFWNPNGYEWTGMFKVEVTAI
jgi:hypothetical protein